MERNNLYMMIGPAGCGKSYLAKSLCDRIDGVLVSSDSIREELFGDETVQKNAGVVFGLAHERIVDALDSGYDVVFDATNLVPKHRKTCIDLARDHCDQILAVVYTGTLSRCLTQNQQRHRQVPEGVIENMYMTLHRQGYFPTLTEGFDVVMSMEHLRKGAIALETERS